MRGGIRIIDRWMEEFRDGTVSIGQKGTRREFETLSGGNHPCSSSSLRGLEAQRFMYLNERESLSTGGVEMG